MKLPSWIITILFLFLFLILPVSNCFGEESLVAVYIKGEKIELNLLLKEGRYFINEADLIELLKEFYPDEKEKVKDINGSGWVSFRDFWEQLEYGVIWLDDIKSIVVAAIGKETNLPPEAVNLLKEAIADTNWLGLKSIEDTKNHLGLFYTRDIVEDLADEVFNFNQIETDWHSLYELSGIRLLDHEGEWFLVNAEIKEHNYSLNQTFIVKGMVKLELLEKGWRITQYQYFD